VIETASFENVSRSSLHAFHLLLQSYTTYVPRN
jgi:hypothetical protein